MKEFIQKYPVMSRKQLMAELKVSRRTLAGIMAEAGVNNPRRLLRPVEVKMIVTYWQGPA
ncbi:MAG: hypothetical protein MUC97_01570 [Bernardetiaceae bacterium]|jgi:hypothetical protein|nr:hypothetical protein [Bernardetiaceae bacterium]